MSIKIVTAPTVEPIEILGLSALKRHLNEAVDVSDNDDLITAYCSAAWDYAQRYTWRQLITASLRLSLPGWFLERYFSESYKSKGSIIPIPRPKVISIDSVKYYDDSNVLQTLGAAYWAADVEADVCELIVYDFPTVYERPDAVQINYTAGYGTTTASMPPVLLHAVRLLVGQYYESREPDQANTGTVDALLQAIECRDERLPELE